MCSGWERPHRTQTKRGIVFWVKCGKQTLVDRLPNAAGTWALVLGKPWVMVAVARGLYEIGTWLILGASGVECKFSPTTRSPLDLFLSVSLIKASVHPSIVRVGPPCAHWNSSLTYSIKLVPKSLKIHPYAEIGGLFQGLWSFPRGSDFLVVVVYYCGSAVKIEAHNRTLRQHN